MKRGLAKERLKIFLPSNMDLYFAYYNKRVREGVVLPEESKLLFKQLNDIKDINPLSLIENLISKEANAESFHERNGKIVELSNELIAFLVNDSSGTKNTIEQAKSKGIPVKVFTYTI